MDTAHWKGLFMRQSENESNVRYSKSQIADMEREIQCLLGESSYTVRRHPCRGECRGKNDYILEFDSGRQLFISLGYRNYAAKLKENLDNLRYFRKHQVENGARIKEALLQKTTRYTDAEVDLAPTSIDEFMAVYAVVILTTAAGIKLVYRETSMHYCLIGYDLEWCAFDHCLKHFLEDACGEMKYTHLLQIEDEPTKIQKGA